MPKKLKLGDDSYALDELTDKNRENIRLINYINRRIEELTDLEVTLNEAKQSFGAKLKREMISRKAGFVLDED